MSAPVGIPAKLLLGTLGGGLAWIEGRQLVAIASTSRYPDGVLSAICCSGTVGEVAGLLLVAQFECQYARKLLSPTIIVTVPNADSLRPGFFAFAYTAGFLVSSVWHTHTSINLPRSLRRSSRGSNVAFEALETEAIESCHNVSLSIESIAKILFEKAGAERLNVRI